MIFWKLLKRYWYLPVIAIGAVGAFLFFGQRGRKAIYARLQSELDAITSGAEADRVEAELGADEARKHVEDKYAAELAAFDAEKRAEAEKLRHDPEALARFIVRGS